MAVHADRDFFLACDHCIARFTASRLAGELTLFRVSTGRAFIRIAIEPGRMYVADHEGKMVLPDPSIAVLRKIEEQVCSLGMQIAIQII